MLLNTELKQLREKVNEIKAEKRIYSTQLVEKEVEREAAIMYGVDCIESRAIIQAVAENTQGLMVKYFCNLISPIIRAIWEDDRSFGMEFVQKRNTTECNIWIEKDGNRAGIFDGGGGLANIVSLGCRLAFFALEKKTRKLMFLDEPFSALNSASYQQRISDTLKEISAKMGIQFLVITDQIDIQGDRLFRVEGGQVRVIE